MSTFEENARPTPESREDGDDTSIPQAAEDINESKTPRLKARRRRIVWFEFD